MKAKDKKFSEACSPKRLRSCALLLVFLLSALTAFPQRAEWTIGDYLKNLPEKYKTYSGDFQKPPRADAIVVDEENGYAAILNSLPPGVRSTQQPYPIFEMTLFWRAKGEPLVVVSNRIYDSVCIRHETFFLERRGGSWLDVRSRVLPNLSAEMFFNDPKLAAKLRATNKKIGNSAELDLHFAPPRKGTRMKAQLDICDYVPDEFQPEINFDEFTENAKPVFLDWDKQKGVFKVAR